MKILLRFYLQNNKLPIDYRRIMLSFFKRSLSDIAEGKYYEKYYFTPVLLFAQNEKSFRIK